MFSTAGVLADRLPSHLTCPRPSPSPFPFTTPPSNYVERPRLADRCDISACTSDVSLLNLASGLRWDNAPLKQPPPLRPSVSRRGTKERTKTSRNESGKRMRERIHPVPAEFTLIYWGQCWNHLNHAVIGRMPAKQACPPIIKHARAVKHLVSYLI